MLSQRGGAVVWPGTSRQRCGRSVSRSRKSRSARAMECRTTRSGASRLPYSRSTITATVASPCGSMRRRAPSTCTSTANRHSISCLPMSDLEDGLACISTGATTGSPLESESGRLTCRSRRAPSRTDSAHSSKSSRPPKPWIPRTSTRCQLRMPATSLRASAPSARGCRKPPRAPSSASPRSRLERRPSSPCIAMANACVSSSG